MKEEWDNATDEEKADMIEEFKDRKEAKREEWNNMTEEEKEAKKAEFRENATPEQLARLEEFKDKREERRARREERLARRE